MNVARALAEAAMLRGSMVTNHPGIRMEGGVLCKSVSLWRLARSLLETQDRDQGKNVFCCGAPPWGGSAAFLCHLDCTATLLWTIATKETMIDSCYMYSIVLLSVGVVVDDCLKARQPRLIT